jgi:hypothetical protein
MRALPGISTASVALDIRRAAGAFIGQLNHSFAAVSQRAPSSHIQDNEGNLGTALAYSYRHRGVRVCRALNTGVR